MSKRNVVSPAFQLGKSDFELTPDAKRVVDYMQQRTGKSYAPKAANSVMAQDGKPVWGSGGGFAEFGSGESYVDPFQGSTAVVAHEGGHALAPTSMVTTQRAFWDPRSVPRDTGARMRLVHETAAKPLLIEESHAQGVAAGVMDALGLPSLRQQSIEDDGKSSWMGGPMDYPSTYHDRGLGLYGQREVGPMSPAERQEGRRILRGSNAAMDRTYREGYWSMR